MAQRHHGTAPNFDDGSSIPRAHPTFRQGCRDTEGSIWEALKKSGEPPTADRGDECGRGEKAARRHVIVAAHGGRTFDMSQRAVRVDHTLSRLDGIPARRTSLKHEESAVAFNPDVLDVGRLVLVPVQTKCRAQDLAAAPTSTDEAASTTVAEAKPKCKSQRSTTHHAASPQAGYP